jgi:hypothetical protein
MTIVHSTPVLQSTTRTGKAKFWQECVAKRFPDLFSREESAIIGLCKQA